eukprot:scaffold48_cov311-Pinguiococcus_pyrenoidosus.AAC.10
MADSLEDKPPKDDATVLSSTCFTSAPSLPSGSCSIQVGSRTTLSTSTLYTGPSAKQRSSSRAGRAAGSRLMGTGRLLVLMEAASSSTSSPLQRP